MGRGISRAKRRTGQPAMNRLVEWLFSAGYVACQTYKLTTTRCARATFGLLRQPIRRLALGRPMRTTPRTTVSSRCKLARVNARNLLYNVIRVIGRKLLRSLCSTSSGGAAVRRSLIEKSRQRPPARQWRGSLRSARVCPGPRCALDRR